GIVDCRLQIADWMRRGSADVSVAMRNPYLIGEKVYLRAIEEADTEVCYPWVSDPEVRVHLACRARPNTAKDTLEWIRGADGRTRQMFAIVARAAGEYIGNCDLMHLNWTDRHAELGILIGRKDFWGKGYGREATRLLCDHGFKALNLHRI